MKTRTGLREHVRVAGAALGGLTLLWLVGCESPQRVAREEATQRWNLARAEVKARLASDQFAAGNLQAANAELAEAERLGPPNSERVALRARILLSQGKLDAAADVLERAVGTQAPAAEMYYLLGVAREQQLRWADALDAFLRACEVDERELAYTLAAAEAFLRLQQPRAALTLLAERAGQFAWSGAYQATLAEVHEQLGDWSAAARAWRQVAAEREATGGAAARGSMAAARMRLAEALFQAGEYAEAAAHLEQMLTQREPGSTTGADALRGAGDGASFARELLRARLALGECYLSLGRVSAAREQAQEVLREQSEEPRALLLLARALTREGATDTALRIARRALANRPQHVPTLELVAALAFRVGDRELVDATAQRLTAIEPENPVAGRLRARP